MSGYVSSKSGNQLKNPIADLQASLASSHIPALDGLRAIAVFLVIFYHFGFEWIPGAHGVMIFFVLSGFLITWLLLKENEKHGRISISGFYTRRVLRIFPAFYCYWILLVALLLVTGRKILWPQAISSLLYVSNYYNAINGDPNTGFSHTWSLAIEEQFYLLWPVLFVLLRRNLKRMTLFLTCLILSVWIYRAVLCFLLNVDQGYIYAAFDTRLDHLMVGCLLAVLLKREALTSFWRVACSRVYAPLVTLGLFIASIYFDSSSVTRYRDVIGFAIEPVLIAVMVIQLISLHSASLWRWIDWPALRYLGRISYSLYLYQQITLGFVKKALSSQSIAIQFIAAVIVTILVATASYYLIERPFLKLKNLRSKFTAPANASYRNETDTAYRSA